MTKSGLSGGGGGGGSSGSVDANAALDAAMSMMSGPGAAAAGGQAGASPYAAAKPSTEVEVEHLDFRHVAKCSDYKEVERILRVLRSGREGKYPELEAATEAKLKELRPQSKLLKKMVPMKSMRGLPRAERDELLGGIDAWSAEMDARPAAAAAPAATAIPPVRGAAQVAYEPTPTGSAAAAAAAANTGRPAKPRKMAIPGGNFREWDKFDVDAALKEMDDEDEPAAAPAPTGRPDRTVVNGRRLPRDTIAKKPRAEAELQLLATREKAKGNESFRAGDYDEAIVYYSRSLDACPTAATYNNRALANLKLKRYLKTIDDTARVIELEPGNFKALVRRANALKGATRVDEALEAVNRALELMPTSKQALGIKTELLKAKNPTGATGAKKKKRMVIEEEDGGSDDDAPAPNQVEVATEIPGVFTPASKFAGSRPGFVFHMGPRGLGYYKDPRALPKPAEPAPAPAPATTTRRIAIVEDDDSDDDSDDEPGSTSPDDRESAAAEDEDSTTTAPIGSRRIAVVEDDGVDSDDDSDDTAVAAAATTETVVPPLAPPEPEPEPPVPANVLVVKDAAKRHFQAGQYAEAAARYGEALQKLAGARLAKHSMAATLLGNRAACNLKIGQLRQSVEDCDAAIAIIGNDAKLLLRRAAANEARERFKEAYVDYKAVQLSYPANQPAQQGLARAKQMIEYTGDFKWLAAQRGQVIAAAKFTTSAPALARATPPGAASSPAAASGPDYDELKQNGNALVKAKKYADAAAVYSRCIELDSTQPAAINNRALCYLKLGRAAEAAADAAAVLKLEPGNVKALYRQAQALAKIGALSEAKAAFTELLAIDPKHKTAKAELVAIEEALLKQQLELITKERAEAAGAVDGLQSEKAKAEAEVITKKAAFEKKAAEKDAAEKTIDDGIANMKGILETEIEIIEDKEAAAAAAKAEADAKAEAAVKAEAARTEAARAKAKAKKAAAARAAAKLEAEAEAAARAVAKAKAQPKRAASPSKKGKGKPAGPLQFMSTITRLKVDPARLAAFLAEQDPAALPKLFSNGLEADHLVAVISAAPLIPGAGGFEVLAALTQVKRFDMVSMFLSDADRAAAAAAVQTTGDAVDDKDRVAAVAAQFDA